MRYTGYPSRRYSLFGYFPAGIKWLLISNTVIFLLTALAPASFELPRKVLLELSCAGVLHNFYIWQLVTYMFLHGGIWHLLFNMLTLWMFGTQIEQTWGTRQFLKYYFVCGVGAGICVLIVNAIAGAWYTVTLGASGAVMGVLLAFGVLFPNQTILMNFLFPIKAKYLVMIYAAIELFTAYQNSGGISWMAHLGGMGVGYIYLKARTPRIGMPDVRGLWRRYKMQRAKREFQAYMRKHNNRGPWKN